MPTPSPDDQVTAPAETPQEGRLSEEQLDQVAGAGDGRRLTDCEGYAVLGSQLSAPSKLKQPE